MYHILCTRSLSVCLCLCPARSLCLSQSSLRDKQVNSSSSHHQSLVQCLEPSQHWGWRDFIELDGISLGHSFICGNSCGSLFTDAHVFFFHRPQTGLQSKWQVKSSTQIRSWILLSQRRKLLSILSLNGRPLGKIRRHCVAKVRKAQCSLNANQAVCVPNQTHRPQAQDSVGLTSAEIRSAQHGDDDSKHMELIKWINNPT